LLQDGNTYRLLGSDSVQYVVAAPKSFYYELLEHPELMATYASHAIYARDDKQHFAFKIQNDGELIKLGLDSDTRNKLSGDTTINGQTTGFNAALYREYLTGKYILAFAGTNDPIPRSFDDWRTNIIQAFGVQGVKQYEYANDIAVRLMNNHQYIIGNNEYGFNFNASNTYIAGHSLGGGLASAASIMSGFRAYTFNAAGLHPNTVYNNGNLAIADSLITSYKVDWDILSWGQYVSGWFNYVFGSTVIPPAIGHPKNLDSQYDLEMTFGLTALAASWIANAVPLSYISGAGVVYCGIICHGMGQVIYGMEQQIF
jgi:hypothetical protein